MFELLGLFLMFAIGAVLLPLLAVFFVAKLVLKVVFLPLAIVMAIVKVILLVTLIPIAIGFGIAVLVTLAVFAVPFVIAGALLIGLGHLLL